MDKEYLLKKFDEVIEYLPESLSELFKNLDDDIKCTAQEIRLRAGRPAALTVNGTQLFVGKNKTTCLPKNESVTVTLNEVNECYLKLCNYSVYSHMEELSEGFIMLQGGHRAGICGKVTGKNGKIESIRDISSINIRIAKEIYFCADTIVKNYKSGGVLICGGPGSGKTTLIRDMVRLLASGEKNGRCYKVAVVDSRGEIGAASHGIPTANLGSTCDIITGCPKGKGIEMALRTMYPDIIAFDEIGNMEEVRAVKESMNSGVSVITSAHAGSISDVFKREQIKSLLNTGAIDMLVMCKGSEEFGYTVYDKENIEEMERRLILK